MTAHPLGLSLHAARPIARRRPGWAGVSKFWRDFEKNIGSIGDPTVTAASTRYARNKAGLYTPVPANTPARTDDGLQVAPSRGNRIKNPAAAGGTAGTIGSGGAFPTGWSTGGSSFSSVTRIVSFGTKNGIAGMFVRYQLVAAGAASLHDRFVAGGGASADAGITPSTAYVLSYFHAIETVTAGDATKLRTYANIPRYTAAGAFAGETFGTQYSMGDFTRLAQAFTSEATAEKAECRFRIDVTAAGTYDVTVFIGWPQLEAGAFAGPPIADATETTTDTSAGDQAVYDLAGRLDTSAGVAFVASFDVKETRSTLSRLFEINDGTTDNFIHAYMVGADNKLGFAVRALSVASVTYDVAAPVGATGRMVVGVAVSENYAMARVVGQTAPAADTSVTYPAGLSKFSPYGRGYDTTRIGYGLLDKLAMFDGAMGATRWDNQIYPAMLAMAAAA